MTNPKIETIESPKAEKKPFAEIPIIGNVPIQPVVEAPEASITEYQQGVIDLVNNDAWILHQCLRAVKGMMREELATVAALNFDGADPDLTTPILGNPATYMLTSKLFEEVKKELWDADSEVDDAPGEEPDAEGV